ncbi:MAG: hypothetical protein AB1422_16020 [bacterium]
MGLKMGFSVALISSFINGVVTYFKFYQYISNAELVLLIFLRVLITFIIFFGLTIGIYVFLQKEIPQISGKKVRPKKPTKIDYVLPSVSPAGEKITKTEEKETQSEETIKQDAEALAMVIKTMMAEE